MLFGDISVQETSDGKEFIELRERNSKMLDGTKPGHFRSTRQKIFSQPDSDMCPVKLFKQFCEKRLSSTKSPDSPFYLTPVPAHRLENNDYWYYTTPMGKNTLGTLMKRACQQAGVSGRKTNHSLRKSTVSELTEAGVPPTKIIKITGHKSVSSLQHYDGGLTQSEHESISSVLCRSKPSTSTSVVTMNTNTVTESSANSHNMNEINGNNKLTSIFSNASFQGCSFHINISK